MMYIWRMWRTVVLFRENQIEDAYFDSLEHDKIMDVFNNETIKEETENNFFHYRYWDSVLQPLKIHKMNLISHLLYKYGDFNEKHLSGKFRIGRGMIPNYNLKNAQKLKFIEEIINDCIENNFISYDDDNKNLIFLTDKGVRFSHFSYFLKKIKDDLGTTYSWLLGLIIALFSGISIREIISFFN